MLGLWGGGWSEKGVAWFNLGLGFGVLLWVHVCGLVIGFLCVLRMGFGVA